MKALEVESILPEVFYGAVRQREYDDHGKLCWTYHFDVAIIDVDCMVRGVRVEMSMDFIRPSIGSEVRRKLRNKAEILDGLNDVWFSYREVLRSRVHLLWEGDNQLRLKRFLAIEDVVPTFWERLHA
jgi:hypothetical protein